MTASQDPEIQLSEVPAVRNVRGAVKAIAAVLSTGLSLYALSWVLVIVQPQIYRITFLLIALVLIFLLFRGTKGGEPVWSRPTGCLSRRRLSRSRGPSSTSIASSTGRPIRRRQTSVLGGLTILLVLEAARRTAGWILPATSAAFLVYAWAGPLFDRVGLTLISHRGYERDRLIGTLYMTLEGIYGVPLDVAATYIILFTIYGAVLEHSGAGRFFIDWSMATMARARAGAALGWTVTVAGFCGGRVRAGEAGASCGGRVR